MRDASPTSIRPRRGDAARTWLRLVKLLAPRDRLWLGAAAIAMVLSAALKALVPVAIGMFVTRAVTGPDTGLGGILSAVPKVGALVAGQLLLETARRQLVEMVVTAFERDNRARAYAKLLRADLDRLRGAQTGASYGRANRSIEGSTKLMKIGAMDLLPATVGAAAALVAALTQDWRVALTMAGVIPTGFALVWWQVRNQAGVRVRVRDQKERIDGRVPEALGILDSIRANGAAPFVLGAITTMCDGLRRVEMRHHKAMSLFDAAKSFNEAAWLVVTMVVAVALLGTGPAAAGDITAFVMLTLAVHQPLRELHRIIDETAESSLLARDLLALLDEPDDAGYRPVRPRLVAARTEASAPQRVLDVRNLSFTHEGRSGPSLRGIDLQVAAGERIGIVGASGCGKSTLLRVLRRLHHGFAGSVCIDGTPLEQLGHEELAEMVGFVTQHPQLLQATVADNIRFGLDAGDDAVVEAARRASVHEDIVAMPDGYETVVQEGGTSISGGQRQRICVARALLRRPRVLLLDEPTSALDPVNERAVQASIDALADVTVLIVAHRLDTLRSTDRIVVMERGSIVETGPFESLAAGDGAFARMLAREEAGTDPVRAMAA